MKTAEAAVAHGATVSPAHLYTFLKGIYGSKTAERIFRAHGLPRPVNPLRPAVTRRTIVGAHAWA